MKEMLKSKTIIAFIVIILGIVVLVPNLTIPKILIKNMFLIT